MEAVRFKNAFVDLKLSDKEEASLDNGGQDAGIGTDSPSSASFRHT
jgi:hypothetical protein